MRYDAVAFLEGLFQQSSGGGVDERPALAEGAALPVPCMTPDDLSPDWHFCWDERAAIMEYDGKMPRERAEALALLDVLDRMRQAGEPLPQ
jgi:hypothetical protein